MLPVRNFEAIHQLDTTPRSAWNRLRKLSDKHMVEDNAIGVSNVSDAAPSGARRVMCA